jgi:hypothetical protein
MPLLSNADYLSLWERGRHLHPLDQGLLAIYWAFPDTRRESVADWSLGHRNRALARLSCECFGPTLKGWASCPKCAEKLEFSMDARLFVRSQEGDEQETIEVDGRFFRLPTSRDLACIAGFVEPSLAVRRLLEVCRVHENDGVETNVGGDSEPDAERIGEKMAEADPLAEILIAFLCPLCAESFHEALDLPTFLWAEVEARARRLLFEVHTLAACYGWTETEVLALSDSRRQFYFEMVSA